MITVNGNKSIPMGTIRAVRLYSEKLGLSEMLDPLKEKGTALSKLVEALVAYKMGENFSIDGCGRWLEEPKVRQAFDLPSTSSRTLYRSVALIGEHLPEVTSMLRKKILSMYELEHTDVNLDTSSVHLHGQESELGAHGYSRTHRPDLEQVMFGVVEVRDPVNIPIHLTVEKGNLADQLHFLKMVGDIIGDLRPKSQFVFDAGGDNKDVTDIITEKGHSYLTRKKLNKSDLEWMTRINYEDIEMVDEENGVCCVKHVFGSGRCNYLFYSSPLFNLKMNNIEGKSRRLVRDALDMVHTSKNGKVSISKAVIKRVNPLFKVVVSVQTKLMENEEAMIDYVQRHLINRKEGFFKLESSQELPSKAVYDIYHSKDTIEKLIESLKNHIEIKPIRCWDVDSIKGVLMIGFLAQIMVSMYRYEHPELRDMNTKFLVRSMEKLTATYFFDDKGRLTVIYSNFDSVNRSVLDEILLES